MPVILSIESSTSACSVALSGDGKVLFEQFSAQGTSHASLLGTYVDKALAFAEEKGLSLDAVAVSSGPGSYTGLRIGVSMAKGIAYARQIPLIGVPSLRVLAQAFSGCQDNVWLCPMIDARRMEVYTALFTPDMRQETDVQALVVDADSFSDIPAGKQLWLMGDGASKCIPVISRPDAFLKETEMKASRMVCAAEEAFAAGRFEDVAYFEPFYLKDFQASVPTKLNDVINGKNSRCHAG